MYELVIFALGQLAGLAIAAFGYYLHHGGSKRASSLTENMREFNEIITGASLPRPRRPLDDRVAYYPEA